MAGALLLAFLSFLGWDDVAAYRRHVAELEDRLAAVQKSIQQGLITEAQLPEFKKAVRALDAELELAAVPHDIRSLPDHLVFEAVRAQGIEEADLLAVTPMPRDDELQSAALLFRFCGPPESLESAACEVRTLERVADWSWGPPEEGCLFASAVVYALAQRHATARAELCGSAGAPPLFRLLPLQGGRLELARMQIEEACAERKRLEAIILQVEAYKALREELPHRRALLRVFHERRRRAGA